MTDGLWVETLRQWVIANPTWAGFLIFLVAFTESIVVIGILIPGIMILFALGALIGLGIVDFYLAWFTASLGAILGDSFSYWVGLRYRESLASKWPFSRWPELFEQGRDLFRRRGVMGVVIGRFVGPLRPIVPVVAGMLAMPQKRFYPTAIAAGIAWSPAYLLPGVLLGASLDVASAYTFRLAVLLGILVGISWLVFNLVRTVYKALTKRTPWLLKRSVATLRRHPVLAHYIGPLVIPARGDILSIAMLGIALTACLSVLTIVLLYAVIPGTPDLDALSYDIATALRNHLADAPITVMLFIADYRLISAIVLILSLWLIAHGRSSAAWHWIAASLGAPIIALLVQAIIRFSPAWPETLYDWGDFPDLHMAYASAAIGFFPILLARDLRANQRKWIYLSAAFLIMMCALARMYFQLSAFSALINALLVSTAWCTIVGIGLRVRASAWYPTKPLIILYSASLLIGLIALSSTELEQKLQQLHPALTEQHVTIDEWQQQATNIPDNPRPWLNPQAAAFNLQWNAQLSDIRQTLNAAGWQWRAESPDAKSIIHTIHPQPQSEQLPLFMKDYQGRRAAGLAFTYLPSTAGNLKSSDTEDADLGDTVIVVRFWDSGYRTHQPDNTVTPIWLGEVSYETVEVHGWWFTSWTPQSTYASTALLKLLAAAESWHQVPINQQLYLLTN